MNRNIEVINPNLWAVDFHHLQYIKELQHKDNEPGSLDKLGSMTEDGVLVLNKRHEWFPTMKQIMSSLMNRSNADLKNLLQYMQDKDRYEYQQVYKHCLDTELKRRVVEKTYRKRYRGESGLKKALNLIRLKIKKKG